MQKLFEEVKEEVVRKVEHRVKMFEMNRTTCVATDWSQEVVGFFLFQKHCDCGEVKIGCCKDGWQLFLAESRFLKPNEKNWSPGEGEALSIVYALNKVKHFMLGCKDLYVMTDHKPLLGTFGDRDLEQVENPRMRKLKEKTVLFDFKMVYVPARKNAGTDTLSRNPVCREGLMGELDGKQTRQVLLGSIMIDDDGQKMFDEDPAREAAEAKLCNYTCPMLYIDGLRLQINVNRFRCGSS